MEISAIKGGGRRLMANAKVQMEENGHYLCFILKNLQWC